MTKAIVAIGANLSFEKMSPKEVVQAALDNLSNHNTNLVSVSPFYQTPAFPAGSGADYVNAAAILEVDNSCDGSSLLRNLHEIEAKFGRLRDRRWAARTLDIDLLALGDSVMPDLLTYQQWHDLPPLEQQKLAPQELILPHPRLHERAFVLVPLADIAPDWTHPVLGKTVAQMLAQLPAEAVAEVKRL